MPPYQLLRGLAAANLGDLETARDAFARATADDFPASWLNLAAVQVRLGDTDGARRVARRARPASASSSRAIAVAAADLYRQLGDDPERATPACRRRSRCCRASPPTRYWQQPDVAADRRRRRDRRPRVGRSVAGDAARARDGPLRRRPRPSSRTSTRRTAGARRRPSSTRGPATRPPSTGSTRAARATRSTPPPSRCAAAWPASTIRAPPRPAGRATAAGGWGPTRWAASAPGPTTTSRSPGPTRSGRGPTPIGGPARSTSSSRGSCTSTRTTP